MTQLSGATQKKKTKNEYLPLIILTRSTVLSLVIGLVTVSLLGFSSMLIGTYIFQVGEFRTVITPQASQSARIAKADTQTQKPTGFSVILCPKTAWIDCTTIELQKSFSCTPMYLAQIKEYCPSVIGARY